MANTASAAKRARQTVRRTQENRRVTKAVKTQLKETRETLKSSDRAKVLEASKSLSATLDKAAKTGRIHKNKANRHKSALGKAVAKLAAA